MTQAANSPTTAHVCAATPSEIEISQMIDGLDAADPRPDLTDYAAWIAEGAEVASEVRQFERRRAAAARVIYGDIEEAA
jgi:hypothetical protein